MSDQTVIQPTGQDLLRIKRILHQILFENILPFWYPQVIDQTDGGYRLNHDAQGIWKGRTNKDLVTQARTMWFFSRLANAGYGPKEHVEAARHDYLFLKNRMWDRRFGGFYWEVDSSGRVVSKPNKHLYAQAFGLYALSEFAMASGDSSARELAYQLFSLLESCAHDTEYGGYREYFLRNFSPAPSDLTDYMHAPPDIKSMNTHLHLMEAIIAYYRLTQDLNALKRLNELILVLSSAVVRKTEGECTDRHHSDWTPLRGAGYDRVSYGHDLENVWLLVEACNTVGISDGPLLDLFQTLFNKSLQYGFDRKNGGFYDSGFLGKPADKRNKTWWVQAECLVSALTMYRLTGEDVFFNCFSRTLDWISNHQVDWEHGDWHARVLESGEPTGDKARAGKSPYHNGRAMIQCLALL